MLIKGFALLDTVAGCLFGLIRYRDIKNQNDFVIKPPF